MGGVILQNDSLFYYKRARDCYMTTFIAYGNIHQPYPLDTIPPELLTEKLRQPIKSLNTRVKIRHRCRWVAHFLLWQLLKMSEKTTALLKHIDYSESGRPQLPVEEIDFNISHSGDWVAVILNVNAEGRSAVGIDIECPNKPRDFSALLAHFAPKAEQAWFLQQTSPQDAFYLTWCLREAVLKSQGIGIVKLAEVKHDPILRQIHSTYCPAGQLVFTQALPFYLAFFVNSETPISYQCMVWHEQEFRPVSLHQTVHYVVNPC